MLALLAHQWVNVLSVPRSGILFFHQVSANAIKRIKDEVSSLVGMADVKQTILNILAKVRVDAFRCKDGQSVASVTMHMLAVGPPGTGKTTTCRRIAQWLHLLGVLRTGKFEEASRPDFVGQYAGETGQKTQSVLEKARGGMLFIDEAHGLITGKDDEFGKEAMLVINKYVEDHRDDIIVVLRSTLSYSTIKG